MAGYANHLELCTTEQELRQLKNRSVPIQTMSSLPGRRLLAQAQGALVLACLVGSISSNACGGKPPPVTVKRLPSAVVAHERQVLDPALVASAVGTPEPEAYKVGPGDTILIAVYDHPELSISQYAGNTLNAQGGLSGYLVDNDGTIQFPLIGTAHVAGHTKDQIRAFLQQELALYIKDPKVTVQVAFAGTIRYYLLGQFTSPGLKYSDRPLHLLEALSLGGSVTLENASLRSAYVARGGKQLPVDFFRLIREGDLKQNIKLRTGDVIVVPDSANEQAFVFGGVSGGNPRGGPVHFINGRLSLLQALAQVGFGNTEHFQGNFSETLVIRSEGDQGELFIVDAERILNGEAASFELAPGDVVYVPATAITDWNQALGQILPTLQTISGLLAPFVQIKFLSE